MSTQHFATLRRKINKRLHTLALDTGQTRYRWLYGALGVVPTSVMFVCGNPSQRGVEEKAGDAKRTGIQLTIEAQWGSGLPLTRLRPVLCRLGLKQGAPGAPGGWQCYLTNVVKEMTLKSLGSYSESEQHAKALAWAGILEWELQQVRPTWVFCMGHPAFNLVTWLQKCGRLPTLQACGSRLHRVWHYSTQRSDSVVKRHILEDIKASGFPVPPGT